MSLGASEPQRFPHPLPHPQDLTARTIGRVRTHRVPLLPSTQPQVLQGTQDLCDGCLGSGQIPTSPISSTQRRGPGKPHGDFPPAPQMLSPHSQAGGGQSSTTVTRFLLHPAPICPQFLSLSIKLLSKLCTTLIPSPDPYNLINSFAAGPLDPQSDNLRGT